MPASRRVSEVHRASSPIDRRPVAGRSARRRAGRRGRRVRAGRQAGRDRATVGRAHHQGRQPHHVGAAATHVPAHRHRGGRSRGPRSPGRGREDGQQPRRSTPGRHQRGRCRLRAAGRGHHPLRARVPLADPRAGRPRAFGAQLRPTAARQPVAAAHRLVGWQPGRHRGDPGRGRRRLPGRRRLERPRGPVLARQRPPARPTTSTPRSPACWPTPPPKGRRRRCRSSSTATRASPPLVSRPPAW